VRTDFPQADVLNPLTTECQSAAIWCEFICPSVLPRNKRRSRFAAATCLCGWLCVQRYCVSDKAVASVQTVLLWYLQLCTAKRKRQAFSSHTEVERRLLCGHNSAVNNWHCYGTICTSYITVRCPRMSGFLGYPIFR